MTNKKTEETVKVPKSFMVGLWVLLGDIINDGNNLGFIDDDVKEVLPDYYHNISEIISKEYPTSSKKRNAHV